MKKGQISIFVIVGLIIISIVILFFLFGENIGLGSGGSPESNSESFITACIEDKLEEGINIIEKQGGYIDLKLYKDWEEEKIAYLCYTSNYYRPCISQEPILITRIEKELKNYIDEDFEECFADYGKSLEKQNYEVSINYKGFDLDLIKGKVILTTNSEVRYSRSGESSSIEDFEMIIPSKIYDLGIVVQEITSQEAKFCNFDSAGFMLLYSDFKIDKFKTSNLDVLYTITHKKSQEEFKFFVRGCVIPPGF
jgi:hypothetical protein